MHNVFNVQPQPLQQSINPIQSSQCLPWTHAADPHSPFFSLPAEGTSNQSAANGQRSGGLSLSGSAPPPPPRPGPTPPTQRGGAWASRCEAAARAAATPGPCGSAPSGSDQTSPPGENPGAGKSIQVFFVCFFTRYLPDVDSCLYYRCSTTASYVRSSPPPVSKQ